MAQRYSDPRAHTRMARGVCPECGDPADAHGGWGGPRCSLTDTGVAQRVHQYEQDLLTQTRQADTDSPEAP